MPGAGAPGVGGGAIVSAALRAGALAGVLLGCGSAATPAVITSPFTEAHATLYDDAVDFVDDPTILEGRWRDDWSRQLSDRVGDSDGVFVVRVRTIRSDVNPDREVSYRLVAETDAALRGRPPNDEWSLPVGSNGDALVEGNETRLLETPFVLFVKYYAAEDGSVKPHWHLSPASDGVVRRVEYLIERHREAASSGDSS